MLNYGTKNVYLNKETTEKVEYLMEKSGLSISQVLKSAVDCMYNKVMDHTKV